MQTTFLVLGDTHCGADSGLLSPEKWCEELKVPQSLFWGWFLEAINEYGPFDRGLAMGDMVDGEGKKGQLNTLIPNTLHQADAAVAVMEATGVPSNKWNMVRGTGFHVTGTYEYEDPIAKALGSPIADDQYLDAHGLKIHLRHVIGRSDTGYGQGTAVLREVMRDLVSAVAESSERCDLIIRAHAHYYARADIGKNTGIINPCMQLPGSIYGRKCRSMFYHVGFGKLVVRSKTDWTYQPILMPIKTLGGRNYTHVE